MPITNESLLTIGRLAYEGYHLLHELHQFQPYSALSPEEQERWAKAASSAIAGAMTPIHPPDLPKAIEYLRQVEQKERAKYQANNHTPPSTRRWYLDTEFAESGYGPILLISVALVSSDGQEYYACLRDGWHPHQCNDWVRANVLPKLPPETDPAWRTRARVALELQDLFRDERAPEIWGYYADYDWVVLCQLFGTMMDLPENMPRFCRDLQQELHRLGMRKAQLPTLAPDQAHNALTDARWLKTAHETVLGMDQSTRT